MAFHGEYDKDFILGNTPLHIACERGFAGQVEMLTCKLDQDEDPGLQKLELPQDVNVKNYSGKLRCGFSSAKTL